jgi:lysophospholipase L1-like esterase
MTQTRTKWAVMRRALLGLTLVALLAVYAAAAPGIASSASAASKATYYLALGDSLAAGCQPIGPPFCFGRDFSVTELDRGSQGCTDQLFKAVRDKYTELQLVNRSCGGETTGSMIVGRAAGSICTYPEGSQLNSAVSFLRSHRGEIAFITIDIGANDILGACFDPSTGLLGEACVQAQLPTLGTNLATILGALAAVAPGVPIAGMSYYNPLLGYLVLVPGPVGQFLAQSDEAVAEEFDSALVADYQADGALVADVAGAFGISDFTDMAELKGFGQVPLNVANACNWTWFCTPPPLGPDIHATTDGYGVIAQAFEDVLP